MPPPIDPHLSVTLLFNQSIINSSMFYTRAGGQRVNYAPGLTGPLPAIQRKPL